MRIFFTLFVIVAVAAGAAGFWYFRTVTGGGGTFRTVLVEKGNLLATISATGTLQAEEVIDVGAQVAGQIKEFGVDPRDPTRRIDYNSEVEEGTVLAQIDDALFQARVDKARALVKQARAQEEQAEADLKRAQADVVVLNSKLRQAERDWERGQRLLASKAVSEAEYDTFRSTFETARANIGTGEAAIGQAKAAIHRAAGAVAEAEADLREAERNLGYTRVTSPVKGVIIDRRVNVGQTVVASLNAPSLFLIAKDIKRLQVWAAVNEADLGQIHGGQTARFHVDARPDLTFTGQVIQVRLNATMTNNVVTYTVVLATDNSQGLLKPYQTANLHFEVAERKDAVLIPNSALRWRPQIAQVVEDAREEFAKSLKRKATPARGGDREKSDRATVWIEEGDFVRPLKIRTGLTDGSATELVEGDLTEGSALVIGEVTQGNAAGTANPFTPQMFGGGKKKE